MQQASGGERGGGGGVIEASMCARYAMYSVKEFFFFWVYQVHISNLVFFLTKSNNTTFLFIYQLGLIGRTISSACFLGGKRTNVPCYSMYRCLITFVFVPMGS